jgi:hypothetical protein
LASVDRQSSAGLAVLGKFAATGDDRQREFSVEALETGA